MELKKFMNTKTDIFLNNLSTSRIIVILRNIEESQIEEYVGLLEEKGLNTLEVTLNSPNPFSSIKLISKLFPKINLGAGTVIQKNDIEKLLDLGVNFIVSPNTDPEVIEETLKKDLVSIPGFYSASEGLNAIKYGAKILKLFPSGLNGINLIKDYSSVFPSGIKFIPTGGVNQDNIKLLLLNAYAVGLGGSLFNKNISLKNFSDRINEFKLILNE